MKNVLLILLFAITSLSAKANASCVAQMLESHYELYEGKVLNQSESGYYNEFANEFRKKGYEVCVKKKCNGQKINIRFQVSFASMHEKINLPFGWDIGNYYTALVIRMNNRKSTSSFSSPNLAEAIYESKERLSNKIPQCNH